MCGLDFTVGNIIFLLPLKRLHLRFGQHLVALGNMVLQCRQTFLERFEVVTQPDRADAGGRNEDAALAQLVGDAHLAECRLLQRKGRDGRLRCLLDTILGIGLPAIRVDQRLDTAPVSTAA